MNELERFSPDLASRERWLVINKLDLLGEEQAEAEGERIIAGLGWSGPVYRISALRKVGTQKLVGDIMTRLEHIDADAAAELEGDYDPAR